jgi:hypothetical protein
MKEPKDPNLGS